MAELLKFTEGQPDVNPHPLPIGLSPEALALDAAAIWSRIEGWTSYRWLSRSFVAILRGPGEWVAPVEPVTFAECEIWRSDHWELSELRPSPLGLELGCGTFRITGTAGDNTTPPAEVLEAYRRFAEYLAESQNASPFLRSLASGDLTLSYRSERVALSQALQLSGAADLLRPYRRLK